MLKNMHGSEGMDPYVIYRACNASEPIKCYGKTFRWDPLLYIKFEMLQNVAYCKT